MKKVYYTLKRQDGSTFVFSIMIISILSVLGLALITGSMANWMMSMAYVDSNSAFYEADGTMKKIQAILERAAIKGQQYAQEMVDKEAQMNEMTDEDIVNRYNELYNEYICDGYGKEYIIGEFNKLKGHDVIIKYEIPKISDIEPDSDISIKVRVQKTVNKIRKTVSAEFELLKQPELLVIEKEINVEQPNNPIWNRPVTTEKNLVAVGAEVTIEPKDENADAVYAWGTVPNGNNQPGEKYGGIIAGLEPDIVSNIGIRTSLDNNQSINLPQKGTLNILGKAVTRGYIHALYGNSSIIIGSDSNYNNDSDDDDYDDIIAVAQSTQTEKKSKGGQIKINGNLLLSDDLEVNGQGDYIKVEGSLFAFRSGTDDKNIGNNYHNQSSSIIYNDSSYESTIDIGKQIFIGGVAFVESVYRHMEEEDLYIPYKTGESLSIGGNYNAYRYGFAAEDEEVFDYLWRLRLGEVPDINDPEFPMYSGVGEDLPEQERERERELFPNKDGTDGMERVRRFAKYVKEWYADREKYDSYVAMGNINPLKEQEEGQNKPDDYIIIGSNNEGKVDGYSLGVVPANGKVYFPLYKSYIEDNPDLSQEEKNLYYAAGIRPFNNLYSEKFHTELQTKWEKTYNRSTYILDGDDSQPKKNSEFHLLVDESAIDTSATGPLIKRSSRAYLYLRNHKEDNNEEQDDNSKVLDLADLPIKKGLIYSNGDVYITNSSGEEITFEGAIVAKGNIVFFGNGNSKIRIKFNEYAVKDAIKLDQKAVEFFSKGAEIKQQRQTKVRTQATTNVRVVSWKETNEILG